MASKKNQPKKQPTSQQGRAMPKERNQAQAKNLTQAGNPNWYVIPGLIFILCFMLYGNSINHGYVLDDDIYTQKNVYVQKGFSAIKDIFDKGSLYGFNKVNESNYRPLVLLDFMAETQVFGPKPHVNHFFNVLFFALCCILIYYLMLKIFKGYNPVIPLTVTLLFLFHPIHTEVVANIKSRDEILGLLFGVISFYFILTYAENRKRSHYAISIIAFVCAILSKENALTYMLIIPLLLYFFTTVKMEKIIYLCIPYVVLIGIYMIIRKNVLSSVTFNEPLEVINNSLMSATSGSDRFATECMMMGKYIYMLFIPYPLSWDYSYNQVPIVSLGSISFLISVLVYAAMMGYAGFNAIKSERTPDSKTIYAFSILFYLITIFLSSNLLVKIGSSFAERFLFVPSLGFCMSLPLLVTSVLNINPKHVIWQNKVSYYGVIGIILVIFAFILIPRNNDWKDNFTLFQSGVISAPNSARTHDALAREYRSQAEATNDPQQKGRFYASSLDEFRKAIAIYQKDADIYYNMGVSFYEDGMQDSALNVYRKAVAVDPHYMLAYNNLGVISFNRREYDSAVKYFMKSYYNDTNDMQALVNTGAAYQNEGNVDKALYYYNKVLSKDPHNANVMNNLVNMYVSSGMSYFDKKDYDNAYNQFTTALKYNPNAANALGNIGVIYQSKGDFANAITYYQKALSIDPKNEVFSRNLQMVMAAQNKSK